MLRRIFKPKTDAVIEKWTHFHNEELNNLNCSQNVIRVITSRTISWAGNVARIIQKFVQNFDRKPECNI